MTKETKAILKLNWNLTYIGSVYEVISIAKSLGNLTPVESCYLNGEGGVFVEREDSPEIELEFLNGRSLMSREEYEEAKDKELS